MAASPSVLCLKITLEQTDPPIWRRIEVLSNATFWDLHVAIQDAMGWCDCHLHQFAANDKSGAECRIGVPDIWGMDESEVVEGWKRKLSPVFRRAGDSAGYAYDFGDGWEHLVVLESISPAPSGATYPRCVAGELRCPPEDCGGPWGYEHLLTVLADPSHDDHDHLSEWAGGPIDPEEFAPEAVVFSDPKERLQFVMR